MAGIQDDIVDLFDDDDVSYPAVYTPEGGGPPVSLRVIFSYGDTRGDLGNVSAIFPNARASIQTTVIANPAKGAVLEITLPSGPFKFRIKEAPLFDRIALMADLSLTQI